MKYNRRYVWFAKVITVEEELWELFDLEMANLTIQFDETPVRRTMFKLL